MAELVKDVVCGMEIDPKESAGKSEYQGATYYFCSETCKRDFDADPQKYLPAEPAAAPAAPGKRWWEFWRS
jgi:YHS domain-containing protein